MADIFGAFSRGYSEGSDRRRQKQQSQIDDLVKYAQLAESGYNVKQVPGQGIFGRSQMVLEQNPNFQSLKELQRRELSDKLEMNDYKKKAMRKYFGGGDSSPVSGQPQAFGAGSPAPSAQEDWVVSPDGRFVPNPNKPKPMNEKDRLAADKLRRQAEAEQEAQANKEEMLTAQAQDNLNAIEEAKKGKQYFGMFGNVPSKYDVGGIIQGQYGSRKKWENNINKVLSGKVLEVMNQMKAASKTGATGFGALNEKELAILQGASTALSRDLSPDDAMQYLNEMERLQRKMLSGGKKFGQPSQGQGTNPSKSKYEIVSVE